MLRDVVSSSICRATRRRTPSCPVPDVLIPPLFLMEFSAAIAAMDALDRFQSSPAVHEHLQSRSEIKHCANRSQRAPVDFLVLLVLF